MKDTTNLDQLQMDNGWYRIPERETVKTIPEFPVGEKIKFSRVIGRAGYRIQYTDIPNVELNRLAFQIIQERVAEKGALPYLNSRMPDPIPGLIVTEETIKAILVALDWMPRSKDGPPFNYVDAEVFDMEGRIPPLRWVYKEARSRWFHKQKGRGSLRTFWYRDLPDGEYWTAKIRSRPLRWIGSHVPASRGGWHSSYYDDYDPAYLETYTSQQVYKVERWDVLKYTRGLMWHLNDKEDNVFLVHPLDAELV